MTTGPEATHRKVIASALRGVMSQNEGPRKNYVLWFTDQERYWTENVYRAS